jgi:phage terminase small subunit
MSKDLTAKQQKFCNNIALKGMNQSDAYRDAYNAENMKPETINVNASQLTKDTKIALRIKELKETLQKETMKEFSVSKAKLLEELEEIKKSTQKENPKLSVDCIKEQGKMQGYYEDTVNLKGQLNVVKGLRAFKNRENK